MSSFEAAIPVIMAHEGTDTNFWVCDADDLGGETVWGWSTKTIKSLGLTPRDLGLDRDAFTPGCLKVVKKSVCQELYRKHFWDKYGFGNIADQTCATKVFDMSVNAGPTRACRLAQAALVSLGQSVSIDGAFGPKTFAAINATLPKKFVKAYATHLLDYYQAICVSRPANKKFLPCWTKRSQWGVVA
jgi:lysozyme family protein